MDNEIVQRLEAYAKGAEEQGVQDVADGLRSAVAEIERLREELTASHESHGNEVGALTERLALAIHERDVARREVCAFVSGRYSKDVVTLDRSAALEEAEQRGWDCFKEATDDR